MTHRTRVVSIVTPVHGPSARFLPEAYESVLAQVLPEGWSWQWLVQADGPDIAIPDPLHRDDRVCLGSNRALGPAVARTTALARASGEVIRNLDADDRLLPGALARDLAALQARPEIGWVVSSALDLHPDGSTTRPDHDDPPPGLLEPGWLRTTWQATDGHRLPVVPGTMSIRSDLLILLGGWMALPASEDTGLLVAASTIRPGYFIDQPSLLYRKHPDQSTAQADHADPDAAAARRRLIGHRADALARLLGSS
ncbi:MAG: glycosyltransferase [Dermatophilaceae bacterium]